eukprot:NODE_9_length_47730_cov_0.323718.p20 type:complete len:268 gc:universal NODE_9_length_47730_cov_0.323718:47407-46604(-)
MISKLFLKHFEMLFKSFGIAMGIQAAVGIPSTYYYSEKLYDLSGALTHIALVVFAMKNKSSYHMIANAVSIGWAVRLGGFLAYRMYKTNSDTRFEKFKNNRLAFFNVWIFQALWCTLIQAPLILMNLNPVIKPLTLLDKLLACGWISSVLLEAVADQEKWNYKANRKQSDPGFTYTGLWKYSQHPNYFFEICTWTFAWLYCCRSLPLKFLALGSLSPIFTSTLLLGVSGIPLSKCNEKYGKDPRYQEYEKSTSILVPWPPSKLSKSE